MTPKQALIHWGVRTGAAVTPITVGLIHASYRVEARGETFVLQQLHPLLSHPSLTEDYDAVTRGLAEGGVPAQRVVRTRTGALTVADDLAPERQWRLLTFVPGRVFEVIGSGPAGEERARGCGGGVARFHHALSSLKWKFKSRLALHPYDVGKFYRAFEKTMDAFARHDLMRESGVQADVAFLRREIPKLLLPAGLPERVVHGDLKISNFVFEPRGSRVRTIIDLDTCARFSVLYELGDALRSWCGGAEDDPKNKFNVAVYRAAVSGYEDGASGFLSRRELALLPRAVKLITLNLASRFLRDYFEDSYFGFDPRRYATRRAANLARARGQIALYLDEVGKF